MKIFILFILFVLSIHPGQINAMPGFSKSMSECEISYFHFCDEFGPTTYNMCPKTLLPSHKDICIINKNQKLDIINSCKKEISHFCEGTSRNNFLITFTCLSNPKNWKNTSKKCLESLSSNHHKKSENINI